jgi:hypothetical protein
MTLAKMYSFQLVMKTKTEVATSPERRGAGGFA